MFAVNSDGESVEFHGLPPWVSAEATDSARPTETTAPTGHPAKQSFASRHTLAIVLAGTFVLCGGCVAALTSAHYLSGSARTTTVRAPNRITSEEKYVDDLNRLLGDALNRGRGSTDFWNRRFYDDGYAKTGHKVCDFLGSHTYSEAVNEFKLQTAIGYPTDSDAQTFVDIAIDDLCPQYSVISTTTR